MIYLNHAATTYPKPKCVIEQVNRVMNELPQSQYRGVAAASDSQNWKKLCRISLARLFQIQEPERIFFTSGSTEAINMAVLGVCRSRHTRKKIVITAAEHNAVLRTVFDGLQNELKSGELSVTVIPCDSSGYIDPVKMKEAVTEDTLLVIVNHCSNVTGAVQNMECIGEIASAKGAYFLADVSQSAGTLPVDVEKMHIDMLAFTGHKGLWGIQGSGGLYVRPGIELRPILFGGTGTDSSTMIPSTPFFEVGTANMPGIAGLYAGTEYVLQKGIEKIMRTEHRLMKRLFTGLKECKGVTVYAQHQPEGTALSFNVKNLEAADVGYILAGNYSIQVRTGLHCAPLIHEYLGTQKGGTVRVSISLNTTEEEIDEFLMAVKEIAEVFPPHDQDEAAE